MFFLKKKLDISNLSFSKKVRSTLLIYNYKIDKTLINIKKSFLISKEKRFFFYFTELLCQLKKNKCNFKRRKLFRNLLKRSRNVLRIRHNRFVIKTNKRVKRRRFYFSLSGDEIDTTSIINLLKVKTKFQYIRKKGLRFCKLFFKYTGSNFFGTITDSSGNVYFSYSSGLFDGLRTRKEKTTIFVAKQLGELLALRFYKSDVGEIIFVPLINHRKIRTLLRFLVYGFREIKYSLNIVRVIPKRKIMRNGVRLRKVARK